jgi:hypothetical protein
LGRLSPASNVAFTSAASARRPPVCTVFVNTFFKSSSWLSCWTPHPETLAFLPCAERGEIALVMQFIDFTSRRFLADRAWYA